MFLIFIILLIMLIVVVSLLTRVKRFNSDLVLLALQTKQLTKTILDSCQNINSIQEDLDEKTDALLRFINERNTYVTFQQEQFKSLAKSDMLSARREELRRTKELKVALERLVGVSFASRQPASPNDVLAIDNLSSRIKELEEILKNEK